MESHRDLTRVPARSRVYHRAPAAATEVAVHPRFRELPPPVIVIGMHRSGTSLAAGMLSRLGVYLGPTVEVPAGDPVTARDRLYDTGYAEAVPFRLLNEQILGRAGSRWDSPARFVARREALELGAVHTMSRATFGTLRRQYLRALEPGQIVPWGWKDPRNSLTLAYWLRLFPDARVIHVRRDPEAAARSLWRRSQAWSAAGSAPLPPAQRLLWWATHPGQALSRGAAKLGVTRSERAPENANPCADLDYCRALCAVYVRECLAYEASGVTMLDLHYEDVVADPLRAAHRLAEYTGVRAGVERLESASAMVRKPAGEKAPA